MQVSSRRDVDPFIVMEAAKPARRPKAAGRKPAAEMLHGAGVAVTKGRDFDAQCGHRTLRYSHARAKADFAEGPERLAGFMAARGRGDGHGTIGRG